MSAVEQQRRTVRMTHTAYYVHFTWEFPSGNLEMRLERNGQLVPITVLEQEGYELAQIVLDHTSFLYIGIFRRDHGELEGEEQPHNE